TANFRLLYGCGGQLSAQEAEEHVQDVVKLFMRAYRHNSVGGSDLR
ncbi:TetR family transcriptional regulator, partial [Marinobacter sp. B9-2]